MARRKDYAPLAVGPLQGVKIIDLSRLFAGNVLTQILGDFGADVVKVEPPEGDTLRQWKVENVDTHWQVYARNKRSLCLDLRDDRAIAIVKQLAKDADIVIESFRPGVLEDMGLSPEELLAINPRLCIGRISGWGQTGPYAQRPGFGTIIEGFSGFASMNGFDDREPLLPPMYLADGVAGLHGAAAIMIALRQAEVNGGKGQIIDLALLDPLLALLGPQAANYALTGKVKLRTASRSGNSAPRNVYQCEDGQYLCLSASTQGMAERLFTTIGRADLIRDPRFCSNVMRLRHVEALDEIIANFIGRRPLAENLALFNEALVTVGPINHIGQILADPHVEDRELFVDLPTRQSGVITMSNILPGMTETPGALRFPAPKLGQDSHAILSEIGVDDAQFQDLVASAVVIAAASD